MISPQLKASRAQPGNANPTLLFAALQEFFEQGSRSAKAENDDTRRPSANKNQRSNSDELFELASIDDEQELGQADEKNRRDIDDDAPAFTCSALDFEEQNPFTLDNHQNNKKGDLGSLFLTKASKSSIHKSETGFAMSTMPCRPTGKHSAVSENAPRFSKNNTVADFCLNQ